MKTLFKGTYNGKKVLLTGHTGFKGSWLQFWLMELGADVTGFALKPNTTPSHVELLKLHCKSIIGDIRNAEMIKEVVEVTKPDIVFHLAAQPLVRRSYEDPSETFQTNILGTVNLFEAIRNSPSVKAVVNVTTDKVYRNLNLELAFRETDVLGGHDPYSTSKACVELIHESYHKSFFEHSKILSATARAGNVIGGGDWSQDRLIPDVVKSVALGRPAEIRNPNSVRPWQHVLDPLSGYLLLGQSLLEGKSQIDNAWNFGPSLADCLSVAEVLKKFQVKWNGIKWTDVLDKDQTHEALVLRLDCSKAKGILGWSPVWNLDKAIEKTASWYSKFYTSGELLTRSNLHEYIEDAISQGAPWIS